LTDTGFSVFWIEDFLSFVGLDKIDSVYQSTSDTKVTNRAIPVNRVNALFLAYGIYLSPRK
jgi:hypothetical protein